MTNKYVCDSCKTFFYDKTNIINENIYEIKQYYCAKCNFIMTRVEVKDTKLEEQIKNTITKYILHVIAATRPKEADYFINLITQNDIILEICQIAKEHYLEVIDNAEVEYALSSYNIHQYSILEYLRKAIEEA